MTPARNKKPNLILHIVVIALAYFITGKLGTYLAIPPGYASAVWPPSGIALAAVLLYGYRVWPGIMLGSLLVNLPTSLSGGLPSEQLISFCITLAISLGAALQAVVGGYLLKRFAGFPNALIREKEIFSLLLLGGIVSTLVNSTLAVSVLTSAGRVPLSNALANWATWWLGDIIGVLILTPLVLVWLSRPVELWRDRRTVITS